MWTSLVTFAVAHAEPSPQAEGPEGPMAIPAGRPPPPGGRREPAASPRFDEAYAASLHRYQSDRVKLKWYDSLSYSSSGAMVGWGGYGPGWGWSLGFPSVWVDRDLRLAIYEGVDRVDVPGAMRALEEPERAAGLERRIRNNRAGATISTVIGVAGLAGSIAGLIGSSYAPTGRERYLWSVESLAASGVMAGGFVIAGFPSSRAERLRFDPTATYESGELEAAVERHNEALASELGLTPGDVGRLSSGDDDDR